MRYQKWVWVFIGLLLGCGQGVSSPAPTVAFDLPDMMCAEGCGAKVDEVLSEQPGAKEVLVDFDSKSATVVVDEGAFDSQAAIAALVDHGFEQSTLKSDPSIATE